MGIGSNQKKKLRAANLALAYSFARSERTEGSAGLQYMVSVVQCKTLSHLPPLPVPKVVVPRSPSVHSHSAPPSPPQLALTYPSSKTVGDEAKRRLIAWRRQKPSLTEAQHHVVSSLCRNRLPEEFAGLDSNVVRDLELVLEHDHWKGSPAGIQWVKSWLAWADPFTNPSKHWFGRTQEKREVSDVRGGSQTHRSVIEDATQSHVHSSERKLPARCMLKRNTQHPSIDRLGLWCCSRPHAQS